MFVEPKQPLSTVKSIDTLYQSTHESLGEGNYGKVYLAKCKETGNRVAVKVVPRRSFKDLPQWQIALLREVSVCMLFPDHVSLFFFGLFVYSFYVKHSLIMMTRVIFFFSLA